MCLVTAPAPMCRLSPISDSPRPWATSPRTCSSRCERGIGGNSGNLLAVVDAIEQRPGDPRREQRLAGGGRPDARHDLLDGAVLQHVAAGSGEDRLGHVVLLCRHADDEHAARRHALVQAARDLHAGHAGHVQVDYGDVRGRLLHELDRRRPVGGLADDLHPGLRQQPGEALPVERMVVGYDDAEDAGRRGGALARAPVAGECAVYASEPHDCEPGVGLQAATCSCRRMRPT